MLWLRLFTYILLFKDGYWSGMWKNFTSTLCLYPLRVICALLVLIIIIFFVDLPTAKLAKHYFNQDFYTCVDFINAMGEGWFIGGIVFSLFIIYQHLGRYNLAIVAKMSFMASIFAGLINTIIKVLINRQRPGIGMDPYNFFHFFTTGGKHLGDLIYASNSMPSGHTITICAAIAPFFLYSTKRSIKIILILVVMLICFARIYTLNHLG